MVLMSQLTQRNLRQMLTFKQSFNTLLESKMKLPKGETIVKEISKLGKSKDVNAIITGNANKFILYVDETKLDTFKSVKDAENSGSFNTTSTGGGGAANVMQPTTFLNIMIKL